MNATPNSGGQEFLSNRLTRAATTLGRMTARIHKKEHGLTAPEFNVLMILANEAPEHPVTSTRIVEATSMDKTKVSRAVSSLDRRAWLERARATSDRRFEYLSLTARGKAAYAKLLPEMQAAEEKLLDQLTQEERRSLELGLSGLDRALGR